MVFAGQPWAWLLVAATAGLAAGLALMAMRRRLLEMRLQLATARTRDSLTGLMTRPEFEAALMSVPPAAAGKVSEVSIVYIGLDDFRTLNDGYGHAIGDAVLVKMASRLAQLVGRQPRVSRLGGDEFAIQMPCGAARALAFAERAVAELGRPIAVDGMELRIAASAGVASHPEHGALPRLTALAMLAMRSVKHAGGNGCALFDSTMQVDMREQAELLQDLRQALERRQLHLAFQPKIDAASLQITAAEALLRWQHPTRGLVPPSVFVPIAERHGLIAPIGQWVIEEACRQAAAWRDRGLRMRVAINISSQQLRQDDLAERIEQALGQHHLPPSRFTCEITETVAMEDTLQTREAFERLRRAGFHISIDDFGTGYSSLATLRRLPAAEMKIDRSFVADMMTSEHARSIVKAIVEMARSLGIRVVAEGVESAGQRDRLVELGCNELQGYLFARPMSPEALILWAETDQYDRKAVFRPSLFEITRAEQSGQEPVSAGR